jgi:RimJ/RimL family protein N-acetyltransferase
MTDARNLRSRAAVERIGLRLEGVLRKYRTNPDGVAHDSTMYSIIDDDWPAVRRRLQSLLKAKSKNQC